MIFDNQGNQLKEIAMSTVNSKYAELKNKGYKYLGYENGWKGNPVEIERCKSLAHKINKLSNNQGDHIYCCDECKIFWQMDSSD